MLNLKMKKYTVEFYSAILKPSIKKEQLMQEKHFRKNISEISDGEYDGVLKRIFKNEMKDRDAFFLNLIIEINGEEYSYGHYCSERNMNFLYGDILIPLGMYASERGISDCLALRDLYIKFEKKSSDKYANLKIHPLFEYKTESPAGSKNSCLQTNSVVELTEEDDEDEIPY